ncbi:NmrA family NAD(P)-binding protein [Pararhizobium sp. LjRoot238]|uniref:NmrA family NAD(P)-binding protein n=1 Tax=Pararhizobium sp. LjRoot238 TaxID=3342293 RepID=UPI003ECFF849
MLSVGQADGICLGGAVVRALQARSDFRVRALTRNPGKHPDLAEEVVEADLDCSASLQAAFKGAHGVFLVTNFWEEGTDELKHGRKGV